MPLHATVGDNSRQRLLHFESSQVAVWTSVTLAAECTLANRDAPNRCGSCQQATPSMYLSRPPHTTALSCRPAFHFSEARWHARRLPLCQALAKNCRTNDRTNDDVDNNTTAQQLLKCNREPRKQPQSRHVTSRHVTSAAACDLLCPVCASTLESRVAHHAEYMVISREDPQEKSRNDTPTRPVMAAS